MDGKALTARRFGLSGFTLIELLLVIAIVALLVSIILPALGQARRTARLAQSISNLKQFGTAAVGYSGEYKDLQPTFSWRSKTVASGYNDKDPDIVSPARLNPFNASSDVDAAARQAAWIIAKKSTPTAPSFGVGSEDDNWFPYARYSHLVLVDFLASPLPGPSLVSPFDTYRIRWAELYRQTGGDFTQAFRSIDENVHGGRNESARVVFSSSYQMTTGALTPDFLSGSIGLKQANAEGAINAFSTQGLDTNPPTYRLGGRKWGDVRFPSQKVYMFEDVSWHVNPRGAVHYTSPLATTAIALFDGSARLIKQNEAAPGGTISGSTFRNSPTAKAEPAVALWSNTGNSCIGVPVWLGPWPDPKNEGQLNMLYRFTVGGLSGVDLGRPIREVNQQ